MLRIELYAPPQEKSVGFLTFEHSLHVDIEIIRIESIQTGNG